MSEILYLSAGDPGLIGSPTNYSSYLKSSLKLCRARSPSCKNLGTDAAVLRNCGPCWQCSVLGLRKNLVSARFSPHPQGPRFISEIHNSH